MKRVALLGSGFIAGVHMEGWKRIPGVEVVAFYEPEPSPEFEQKYGKPRFSSFERLLEEQPVDLVDICLPTFLHRDFTERSARAGKHVFCEKPMALSVEDCRAMTEVCRKNGVSLMVGHALRFWGEYLKAQQLVSDGEIGTVRSIEAYRLALPPGWSISNWIVQPELSGGASLDLHIHDLDFANWLAGEPKEVFARGLLSDNGAWDHAFSSVRYQSGIVAHLEGGWMMRGDFPFTMGFRILGSEGIVEWEFRAGVNIEERSGSVPLILYRNGQARQLFDVQGEDAYYLELKYFLECVERGRPVERGTAEQGTAAVRLALAAQKSMHSGQSVSF